MSLSLEPCTGLQRLDIHCSHDTQAPSLSWTLLLLSKVAAPSLRELAFFIPADDIAVLNLEVLLVVLAHTRYTSLKRLVFHVEVRARECGAAIEARLRERLEDLDARGVALDVVFRKPGAPLCYKDAAYLTGREIWS